MRALRALIEWWGGLSPWLRAGVALAILAGSTALWFLSGGNWYWKRQAFIGWGVGAVLLLASFPNQAEKRGYHDF